MRLAKGHGIECAAGGVFIIICTFPTCNNNCACLLFLFADCNMKLLCVMLVKRNFQKHNF